MIPTRRGVWIVAAVSPLALLGYVTPAALDVVLAIDAIVLLLFWTDARRAIDPRRLRVERVSPVGFSAGRTSTVTYRWTNTTRRGGRLRVREYRPEILGGIQEVRDVDFTSCSDSPAVETLSVTPLRRGRESAGWIAAQGIGPLGLALRQTTIDLPWDITVFPNITTRRLKASLADAMRHPETGLRAVRTPGAGRTFESLREWVPGDDTRYIDWKATARRRKLIARQYEEERRQQVLLVLDAGRLLTADIGGTSRFEYAVSAALALAFAAHRHNDNIGVMVFSDTVHHFAAPQRGPGGLRKVLEVLAVAEPHLVEPDYPGAFRYLAMHNRKRALTVLFTDVIDSLASEALVTNARSLSRRHLPLAVTLRNPDLDAVAVHRPSTEIGAYRKAAAEELLTARNGALTAMRRAGAIVLDVAPEHAGVSVVEKYVELKRRGRL
jgi:uncharacterized protein (DUF58 family)